MRRIIACFVVVLALAQEEQCENGVCPNDGGGQPAAESDNIAARFTNERDENVELHWLSPTGETALMGIIAAHSTFQVNTFDGHQFYFADEDQEELMRVKVSRASIAFVLPAAPSLPAHVKDASDYTPQDLSRMREKYLRQQKNQMGSFGTAFPVKFRNLAGRTMELFYRRDDVGERQAIVAPGEDSTTNSYPTHVFCWVERGDAAGCSNAKGLATMEEDVYTYVFDDGTGSAAHRSSYAAERRFNEEYRNRTGRFWVSFYPREPPALFMWRAERVGQTFAVTTPHAHHVCVPPGAPSSWADAAVRACAPAAQQTFELRAVAVPPTGPRAFVIDGLLSDAEVDHLVRIGAPKVSRSLTGTAGQGAFESTTRTSHNTWINRDKSAVVDTIFRRAADVLNISEALLTQRANAEPLQLVHYDPGQRYDAHYDWGVEKKGPTRYITLLLYLNNPGVGGETAFPKARVPRADGGGEEPLVVHPGKGSAVLFYNLLEDGNADALSMHAALPVTVGEKWLANFWIWCAREAAALTSRAFLTRSRSRAGTLTS